MSHWVWQSFAQYELSDEVESKLSKYHPVPILLSANLSRACQEGQTYHSLHSYMEYNVISLPLQRARDEGERD